MDSGYFDDEIHGNHRNQPGCKYVIKGKEYPTLASQVTDPSITFITGEEGEKQPSFVTETEHMGQG